MKRESTSLSFSHFCRDFSMNSEQLPEKSLQQTGDPLPPVIRLRLVVLPTRVFASFWL
jgi:hypothetical protein